MEAGAPVLRFHDAAGGLALRLTVRGSDGAIEYTEGGEMLSLMKPAHAEPAHDEIARSGTSRVGGHAWSTSPV